MGIGCNGLEAVGTAEHMTSDGLGTRSLMTFGLSEFRKSLWGDGRNGARYALGNGPFRRYRRDRYEAASAGDGNGVRVFLYCGLCAESPPQFAQDQNITSPTPCQISEAFLSLILAQSARICDRNHRRERSLSATSFAAFAAS